MAVQERRRGKRYKVDKAVTIRDGVAKRNGRLKDISAGGAAVSAEDVDALFDEDQELELELDDFGTLAGSVVRTLDDGFAMEFDLDEEGEEQLITEITGFRVGTDYD